MRKKDTFVSSTARMTEILHSRVEALRVKNAERPQPVIGGHVFTEEEKMRIQYDAIKEVSGK